MTTLSPFHAKRPFASLLSSALIISACGSVNARPSAAPSHTPPAEPRAPSAAPSASQSSKQGSKVSKQLEVSGDVKRGSPFPFFSGWALSARGSRPLNLTSLLKQNKRGYVITVCASWCAPCKEGLTRIGEAKERFDEAQVGVVLLVADTNKNAKALRDDFKLDWAQVVVDEFQTYAKKMSTSDAQEALSLPRTFVLNAEGQVVKIIGEEGEDFISLLTGGS